MTSQGWQPGEHLGLQDAAHAEFHTDANFSHIRVSIKDDNLGLGAKIGSGVGAGECTGLDAFQTLLGRLNGRDEDELEKEMKSREDLKRAIYTEQRWGSIRFVRGGLLVGDKIQPLIEAERERVRKLEEGSSSDSSSEEESEEEAPVVVEKPKKSKKRKLEETEEAMPELVAIKIKKSKKQKLEKEGGASAEAVTVKVKSKKHTSDASDEEVTTALKEVKLSKRKSKRDREAQADSEDTPADDEERSRQRKREKKEKKERKREKREKKEKARTTGDDSTKEAKSKSRRDKKKNRKGEDDTGSSRTATKENTPLVAESSGRSTPLVQGMHAIRARNIAQKRMASMDVAALNQVYKTLLVRFIKC